MIKLSKTSKSKDMIIDGDYSFRIKRKNLNYITWGCIKKSCPAKATSPLNYLVNLSAWQVLVGHTHQSNSDKILRREIIVEMKEYMKTGLLYPREVMNM